MKTAITRKMHFNAAHRLHNNQWPNIKNAEVFGKCNNALYHGHNYELEIKVIGFTNPETGFVVDVKDLKRIVNEKVIEPFDHKNLNLEVPDFEETIPTVENIARIIYNKIREEISEELDLKITLYETPRNFAEYPA
ncbi:MAG: 6-pyruvoyl tetrahydrobiopterin synthase [Flavobacteriales bacterium]|nr:6-pyruvoyl tetrahydrobiopterin synthase [Flavobacteriales bacterium]MBO72929.1 6-pyruvoyl tetrahydrobiopterin synthase [Flavobacteriales bacterium]